MALALFSQNGTDLSVISRVSPLRAHYREMGLCLIRTLVTKTGNLSVENLELNANFCYRRHKDAKCGSKTAVFAGTAHGIIMCLEARV